VSLTGFDLNTQQSREKRIFFVGAANRHFFDMPDSLASAHWGSRHPAARPHSVFDHLGHKDQICA
jgi:hypothetical protein